MRIFFILIICCCFSFSSAWAEKSGYKINLELENFESSEIILASYYGSSNVIIDTFPRTEKGNFIVKGEETLDGGVYLIILPPANNFIEILIDKEQHFSLECDVKDHIPSMKITGSKENELFYGYLRYISSQRKIADGISKELEEAKDEKQKEKIAKKREKLDDEVTAYFENIKKKYPEHLNTIIIKAAQPIEMPDELQQPDADDTQRYLYYKKHYFDNLDLLDNRLLRTNFFHKRIEYYLEKLTYQIPDSISVSIDRILSGMNKESDMFKYYLVHFLNKFAKSKIVGMDAVYVHIVQNYYAKNLAPWTDEETLKKIIDNANALAPILIGKTAPDIRMKKRDGTPVSLYDIKSKYIVLYIWEPDCGHCKKASPRMIEFNNAYKDKGVTLFAVCAEIRDEVKKCWEAIDERGYEWLNLVDPYMQSRYKTKYNIKSTPQIFILDENYKIKMKTIGADQLMTVMEQIMERDQKKLIEKESNQ